VPEVMLPLAAAWGQQAQVDWGQAHVRIAGQPTVVHLFCLRMRASGVCFVWPFRTEKLEAFLPRAPAGLRVAERGAGRVPLRICFAEHIPRTRAGRDVGLMVHG